MDFKNYTDFDETLPIYRHYTTLQYSILYLIYLTPKETHILITVCFVLIGVKLFSDYMKATDVAWNMCINKCIVDSWLFRAMLIKGIALSIIK